VAANRLPLNTAWHLQPRPASLAINPMRFVRLFSSLLFLASAAWLVACSSPKPAPQATPAGVWPPESGRPGPARDGGYAWSTKLDDTAQRLRGGLFGSGADVSRTTDQRLWLSLPVDAVFNKGRSAVSPTGGSHLDKVAQALRDNSRAQVQIVGDTDPGASANAALALDRAASARDWMVSRGVLASRILVASRNTRPGPGDDARRLDILIGERATAPAR
jgi:outer membrane protein OmpA-like peptidoglycan-associated protein